MFSFTCRSLLYRTVKSAYGVNILHSRVFEFAEDLALSLASGRALSGAELGALRASQRGLVEEFFFIVRTIIRRRFATSSRHGLLEFRNAS